MPDLTPQLTQLPVGLCFSAHTSPAAKTYARVPAQGNDFKTADRVERNQTTFRTVLPKTEGTTFNVWGRVGFSWVVPSWTIWERNRLAKGGVRRGEGVAELP